MSQVIRALEDVFIEKGNHRVEMPPKPGIHPCPDAFIHAMPAYVPAMGAAGVKWVSGFPQNMPKNLPYISGLLILNDPETGIPVCVMDCTWITAKRTGAATGVQTLLRLTCTRAAIQPSISLSSQPTALGPRLTGFGKLASLMRAYAMLRFRPVRLKTSRKRRIFSFGTFCIVLVLHRLILEGLGHDGTPNISRTASK